MARGRIPFYESQTSVGHVPSTPRAPVDDGFGRALVEVGGIGTALAASEGRRADEADRKMQERADRRAVADAAMQVQDADLQIATFARDTQAATTDDPDGYTGKVAKYADALRDQLVAKATNESGRMALETHFASLRNRHIQSAMGWEAKRATQFDTDRVSDLVQSQTAELVRDPSLVDAYRDVSNMQLDASRLDAHTRETLRDGREKAYRQAIGQGRLARDPQGVLDATGARLGVPEPPEVVDPPSIGKTLGKADGASLYAAVMQQESGGRRYGPGGGLLTSPKGAQGEMQVMPDTARDPGFGVMPARDGSPDELARVGRDYLDAMVREFGGDRMKALAAYNAGPGATKAAVKQWGDQWLAHMPDETKAYVAMIGAKLAQPEPVQVAALDTGTMTDAAVKAPKVGDAWADSLAPDELVRYYHEARTAVDRQQHAARGAIEQQVADSAARADDGVKDAQPIPASAFIAAWGPVEGTRRNYAYQQTQAYANDVKAVQGMPAGQVAMLLDARRKAVDSAEPGAAVRDALTNRLERAASVDMKKREDDAAGYVIRTAPSVKAAADAVFTAPGPVGVPLWLDQTAAPADRRAAMQDYLTRSQAEQQRLGIQNVALLPASAEAHIVRVAQTSGDKMATQVAELADTFGSFWPQVYTQVVGGKNGKSVPDAFVVLPGVESLPGREEVARVGSMSVDDLRKRVPGDVPKQVTEGVQAGLADFFQTMMPNAQNARSGEAIRNVAEKLALVRVGSGAGVKDAVNQAVGVVVGHLDFKRDGSTRAYAVPKGEGPQAVAEGVQGAMDRLGLWNLPAPPDLSGARTPEEATDAWTARVRANPVWVTNGDQTGLLLYTIGENGQPAPVRWKDGRQVGFDWPALRAVGAARRSGPSDAVTAPAITYRR